MENLKSNIEKTLKSGTKLYEVYIENGEIKMKMPNGSIIIGFTAEYIKSAIKLINDDSIAYTRIENDWYGDGKSVKFYSRDSRGINNLKGWINNQLNFLINNRSLSPLSSTEKI